MSDTTTGGSAFPVWEANDRGYPEMLDAGMTLRDYFAAKAMQAVLDHKDVHRESELINAGWIAYKMADAMLKARNE